MKRAAALHRFARQRGAGLVETMVGILIGMFVILAVYSLLSTSEGYKRATSGASDAQINGLLSQFILARDAGNGGNGILLGGDDDINYLASCIKDEGGNADLTMRPIPVLITDSGNVEVSDSFITMNSGASRVNWPVNFVDADSLAGADFLVQSPNGFTAPTPATTPYWVIAAANDGTGRCGRFQVTNAQPAPVSAQGQVLLTTNPGSTITYVANTAKLMNLGPVGLATRVRYEAYNTTTDELCGLTDKDRPCQLYSTDMLTAGAVRNPIAPGIVLVKIQYGVDTSATPDDIIDCWTPANNANVCGDGKDYRAASVQNFTLANLNRILAVRIAVVVRSDEPDLKDPTLIADATNTNPLRRPDMILFNCSANDNTCQSRIVLPMGTVASGKIIQDGYRYRTYETIVPLRNSIYVGTLP